MFRGPRCYTDTHTVLTVDGMRCAVGKMSGYEEQKQNTKNGNLTLRSTSARQTAKRGSKTGRDKREWEGKIL